MTQVVLELPDELLEEARLAAEQSHHSLEAELLERLTQPKTEPSIDRLPDAAVMAILEMKLSPEKQARLSELLDDNSEGRLTDETRPELEALLDEYQDGNLLKAQALVIAVRRGLVDRLDAE